MLAQGATPPKKNKNKKTNKPPPQMQLSDFLKKQRGKKGESPKPRERHSHPSLWPVGTTPPTPKETREVKEKEKKPVDERLQGEAHFSESFAASMEPHSGIGLISHF